MPQSTCHWTKVIAWMSPRLLIIVRLCLCVEYFLNAHQWKDSIIDRLWLSPIRVLPGCWPAHHWTNSVCVTSAYSLSSRPWFVLIVSSFLYKKMIMMMMMMMMKCVLWWHPKIDHRFYSSSHCRLGPLRSTLIINQVEVWCTTTPIMAIRLPWRRKASGKQDH